MGILRFCEQANHGCIGNIFKWSRGVQNDGSTCLSLLFEPLEILLVSFFF